MTTDPGRPLTGSMWQPASLTRKPGAPLLVVHDGSEFARSALSPLLVFSSEQGRSWDFEYNGMVGAMADVIAVGRVKLYGVDRAGAGLSAAAA
jgi:hypothetical protein